MIKQALKKTLMYKFYFSFRLKLNIFYNINFSKFKKDYKYKDQNLSYIFKNIYENKEWGDSQLLGLSDSQTNFFSGTGSYSDASNNYIIFLVDFIKNNNIKSVVDLGCGDFNIGKLLTTELPDLIYIGVDIFQEIVDFNNNNFSNKNISFKCVNTLEQEVPSADILLIREVFQHLSNNSISKVINMQFNLFKNILVTECHPPQEFLITCNLDKPDGPGYRVDHGSGVYLDKHPFDLEIKNIFSTDHKYFGVINTFLINNI